MMEPFIITSSSNPDVSIFLNKDVLKHIRRHFNSKSTGSQFFTKRPRRLLQSIVDCYSEIIRQTIPNQDGYKIISVLFPFEIGLCNVVSLVDLTDEEKSSIRIIKRDDTIVRCATSQRLFPTKECQLILDSHNNVITVYPGELSPPLPPSLDIHDEYWDNHVFIEPISE